MHPAVTTPHRSSWQPHQIVRRIAAADEPDFIELGPFTCGDVVLSSRQHQVMAMFAFGFQSDRIVADYLNIKTKYVQAIVAELKKKYGWQNRREMGRAYQTMRQTVKPEGAKPMKPIVKPVSVNGHTAVIEPTLAKSEPPPVATKSPDPTSPYPAHVIEAAWAEMEKPLMSRRCTRVFTPEVVAVWLDWIDQGKETGWIAENNGLIPTTHQTVRNYIEKHRREANRLRGKFEAEPEPIQPTANDLDDVRNHLAQAIIAAAAIKSISMDVDVEYTSKGLKMSLEIKFKK